MKLISQLEGGVQKFCSHGMQSKHDAHSRCIWSDLRVANSLSLFRIMSANRALILQTSAFLAQGPGCELSRKEPDFHGGEASGALTSMPLSIVFTIIYRQLRVWRSCCCAIL